MVNRSNAKGRVVFGKIRRGFLSTDYPTFRFDTANIYEHVGIYVGNGYVVHAWADNKIRKDLLENVGGKYMGWGWQAGLDLSKL
jgi:cell wall-associated NlpC family hydrolase